MITYEPGRADLRSAIERVQVISSALVTVVGLAYALGLLIVNLHLAAFGVLAFGFAQTEYILAGAVLLFLVAFVRICFYYAVRAATEAMINFRERHRVLAVLGLVVLGGAPLFFSVGLINAFCGYPLFNVRWLPWMLLAIVGFIAFAAQQVQVALADWWRYYQTTEYAELTASLRRAYLFRVLVPLPLLFILLLGYAQVCYPYILPAVGGGRSDTVFLIPTPEGARICGLAKLPANKDNTVFGPLQIIVETSDEIVIRSPKPLLNIRAVRLKRDLFRAVLNRQRAGP